MSPNLKVFIFLFALPVLLFSVDCLILRLPCQTEAFFTVAKEGKLLMGAFLQFIPKADKIQCIKSCVQHPKCKSLSMSRNLLGCVLNYKYDGMPGAILKPISNWTYLSTNYLFTKFGLKCRSASLCPRGVVCRDTCQPPFYECVTCDEFHEGLQCDIRKDLDECQCSPCKNNGTCTDLTRDYSCHCMAGYTGKNCESEINECLSYPCKNLGDCADLFNAYNCTCMTGFTGKNCATNINDCASSPCKNGGTCNDLVNKYSCTCQTGFNGTHCEKNVINECASNPCKNDGICHDGVNKYTCSCDNGFQGSDCQHKISDD